MIILHIGPHKTATTYIQFCLTSCSEELLESGWRYPEIGKSVVWAHHDLAHNPDEYLTRSGKHYKELKALADTGENLIFSAEGLCTWTAKEFRRFKSIFAGHDIEIIYVLRDPISLAYSYWSEEIKQGGTASFADFFTKQFSNPLQSLILNPLVTLAPLKKNPDYKLRLISYEKVMSDKLDIFEIIKSLIPGLIPIEPIKFKPINKRYPLPLTEFLRLMTNIEADGKRFVGSDIRKGFIENTTDEEKKEILTAMKRLAPKAHRLVKYKRKGQFYSYIEKQLATVFKDDMVLPLGADETLFPEDETKNPYYDALVLFLDPEIQALVKMHLDRIKQAV